MGIIHSFNLLNFVSFPWLTDRLIFLSFFLHLKYKGISSRSYTQDQFYSISVNTHTHKNQDQPTMTTPSDPSPTQDQDQVQVDELTSPSCYVALTSSHLSYPNIIDRVRSPSAGAIVLFAGMIPIHPSPLYPPSHFHIYSHTPTPTTLYPSHPIYTN